MTLTQAIDQIIQTAKEDALKDVLPALAAFFTAVATNPSKINIVVQLAKLNADLVADAPTIGQALLQQIATMLQTEAQALLSPTATPVAAPTVPVA